MAWVQPAGCRVPPPRLACLAGLAAGWTGWGLVDWLGAGLPSQGLPGCCCPGAAAAGLLVCLAGLLAAAALGRLLLAGCLAGHLAGGARLLPWGGCCWGAWLAAAALGRLLLACRLASGCGPGAAVAGWLAVAGGGGVAGRLAGPSAVAARRLRLLAGWPLEARPSAVAARRLRLLAGSPLASRALPAGCPTHAREIYLADRPGGPTAPRTARAPTWPRRNEGPPPHTRGVHHFLLSAGFRTDDEVPGGVENPGCKNHLRLIS